MSVRLKEDILKMRFSEVYDRYQKKRLNCEEASDILGMSVRTFLRKRRRYEEEGFEGVFDRRLGKPSGNRACRDEVENLRQLYLNSYRGFSIKHFHDYLKWKYPEVRSYNWVRLTLQNEGIIAKSKQGGPHRQRRERKPMAGMMLHQDASTHAWLPELGHNIDLVVTMDDATSRITSAFFVDQEGTKSSFLGIKETIIQHGLFCTLYTDRGSHYAYTPEAGGKVDKGCLTQVGRALKQLGIKHIHAYSPQARGRSERMFATLQNRLPKELTLQGIKTVEAANQYLKDIYLPRHNELFCVPAKDPVSAYTPWLHHQSLDEILCIQEDRTVQKDNTVRYQGKILQIPPQDNRHHFVKAEVEVREYLDNTLAIFYGHCCLARYDQQANLWPHHRQRPAA